MAAGAASVIGWVEVQPSAKGRDHITLRGHVLALTDAAGRFTLALTRSSKGGKSETKQGGAFKLLAGESQPLSTTTINLDQNDQLTVVLSISVDGAEVFSTTLRKL